MTTNIQGDALEQAYELGRAAERKKIAELSMLKGGWQATSLEINNPAPSNHIIDAPPSNGARKRHGRVAKGSVAASKALEAQTAASKVRKARTARKDRGPREKGVKERIVSMIATAPLTVAEIIAHTGFKATSVRATLMSLKKAGVAMQGDNGWMTGAPHSAGNSEGEAANV